MVARAGAGASTYIFYCMPGMLMDMTHVKHGGACERAGHRHVFYRYTPWRGVTIGRGYDLATRETGVHWSP